MKMEGRSSVGRPALQAAAARLLRHRNGPVLRSGILILPVRAASIVLAALVMLVLSRCLGPHDYGRYVYAISASYLVVILATLGLPMAGNRLVARYKARGQPGHLRVFLLWASVLILLSSAVFAAAAAALLWLGPAPLRVYAVDPAALFGLVAGVSLMRLASETTRALGWSVLSFAGEGILVRLATLGGIGALIAGYGGFGAGSAIAVTAASNLAVALGMIAAALASSPGPRPTSNGVLPRQSRVWLSMGAAMMATPVFYYVLSETDVLMIGFFLEPAAVATYQIGRRMADIVFLATDIALPLGTPRIAHYHTLRRWDGIQRVVDAINLAAVLPSLALFLGFAVTGPFVLRLFGPGYEAAYGLALFLCLAHLVDLSFGPATEILLMTGQHARTRSVNAVFGAANVALGAIAVPLFGLYGAVASTSFVSILWNAHFYRVAKRHCEVEPSMIVRAGALLAGARRPPASPGP